MTTAGIPAQPRREAGLFPWAKFTRDQQAATRRANQILGFLASRQWVPRDEVTRPIDLFLPDVAPSRYNHVVLLDGGRGSGKTVVLLRLLHYWRQLLLKEAPSTPVSDFSELEASTSRASRSRTLRPAGLTTPEPDFAGQIELPRDHWAHSDPWSIVPVGLVDLQPLPESTNLTMFIASQFQSVVRALELARGDESKRTRDDPSPWSPTARTELASRVAWSVFRNAAAIGTEHLQRRSGHLDAETYAVELEQSELSRQLGSTFGAFVDALTVDFKESRLLPERGATPFFVVAIDDADMNPYRSTELLEILRVLSHDRVGYLLTGHSDLFILMLSESLAGGLRSPLRRLALEERDVRVINDFSRLQVLAHQVYDKIIPTAHRCALAPLPGRVRYELLEESLKRIKGDAEPLPSERRGPTPGTIPGFVERSLTEYLRTVGYSKGALPETLRGIEDLKELIEQLEPPGAPSHGTRSLTIIVRELWRDRLNASALAPQERSDLQDAVRIESPDDESGSDSIPDAATPAGKFVVTSARIIREVLSRTIDAGRLGERAVTITGNRPSGAGYGRGHVGVLLATGFARAESETSYAVREISGYEFRCIDDALHPRGYLSPGLSAALMLATDIAADYPSGSFLASGLTPNEFDNPFVGVANYSKAHGERIEFAWPLPNWDSFLDFHHFSEAWVEVVKEVRDTRRGQQSTVPLLDVLAFPFLAIVAGVAYARDGTHFLREFESQNWARSWLEPAWHLLTPVLSALRTGADRFRRDYDNRFWASTRVALLCAPESGLSDRRANDVWDAIFGNDQPDRTRLQPLYAARLTRATRARIESGKQEGEHIAALTPTGQTVDEIARKLLDDIDTGAPDNPWVRRFNEHGMWYAQNPAAEPGVVAQLVIPATTGGTPLHPQP